MKVFGFIIITLLLSACSTSSVKQSYLDQNEIGDNTQETTILNLKPTTEQEYQLGQNVGLVQGEALKARVDIEGPLGNNAQIKIINDRPLEACKDDFAMIVTANVDGKTIKPRASGKTSRFKPGKHIVSVTLTAYFQNGTKQYTTEDYEVVFSKKDIIVITPKIFVKKGNSKEEDVKAKLSIKGSNININSEVILKDSPWVSFNCSSSKVYNMGF